MFAIGLAGSAPRALLAVAIRKGAGGRRIDLDGGALPIDGSRRLVGGEVDEDSASEVASTSMSPPADFPDSSAGALLAIILSINFRCRVISRFSSELSCSWVIYNWPTVCNSPIDGSLS